MKLCCVCHKENSGYKCPTCKQPYCSRICCKNHKETGCEASMPEISKGLPSQSERNYDFPTEDTVPMEKLELLRGSEEIKKCLANRHVRDIVNAIFKDEDPTRAIGLAMTEPIFVELADACLKIVEPPDDEKPY